MTMATYRAFEVTGTREFSLVTPSSVLARSPRSAIRTTAVG